jgi:hypothetical protein
MVFAGAKETITRSYATIDPSLPSLGQIQLQPGSLPAQQQDLVHGNIQREIVGNVMYTLTGSSVNKTTSNVTDTILGNHSYMLQQNLTHTIQGNTKESKLGTHFSSNVGQRTDNFVGAVNRNFQSPTTEKHPESWFQQFTDTFQWKDHNHSYGNTKIDIFQFVLGVDGAKISVDMHKLDLVGVQFKTSPLAVVDLIAMKHKLYLATCKFIVTGLLIGMLELGTPVKPNALPRPTIITPFD